VDNTSTEWLGSGQLRFPEPPNWLLQMATRLIHNRPGPVRCENAWYRSVTSQQWAGPEKGDCG
jgi:hypothetical protein